MPRIYSSDNVELPAYAKPDQGSGSKSAMMVTTKEELQTALSKDLLISEFLPGKEFTVDCVNDLEGNLLYANARTRGRIARSIALGTKNVLSSQIQDYIRKIVKKVKIKGPWFAQFKEGKDGQLKLMEINCRVAGSMAQTRLSGINIPLMCVFLFMRYAVKVPKLYEHVLTNRCLKNLCQVNEFRWIIWDLDDTIIRKDGKPDPMALACLYDCNNRGLKQFLVTKNANCRLILDQNKIPDFFVDIRITEDKLSEIENVLRNNNIPENKCVMVNDSYTENLAIQTHFPGIRTVTSDALEILGCENIS